LRLGRLAPVGLALLFAACVALDRQELRVLTYNIHHGRGTDGIIDLQRIADVILSARPDLVALQEVDKQTGRSLHVDQAQALGELTRMRAHFGRAIDHDGGEYGEALLLGLPGATPETHPLPASASHEGRAALAVTLEVAQGESLLFVGTHLDHTQDPADRLRQSLELIRLFAGQDALVLAGDLNAEVGSEPIERLLENFQRAGHRSPLLTFPSREPEIGIDHVLFRLPGWEVKSIQILDEPEASDHAPLLVVFERRGT